MYSGSRHDSLQGLLLVLLFTLSSLLACGGGGGSSTTPPPPPASLSSITVTPNTATLALGLTQQLVAKGNYSDGSSKDISSAVSWSSSSSSVATITGSGLVSSKAEGKTTIVAASGTVTGQASITVGPKQMTSIAINPPAIFVSRGSVQPFTATGKFSDGSTQDVTATLSWTVKNRFIANGQTQSAVRATSAGSDTNSTPSTFSATTQRNGFTSIVASDGHFSATAKLTVVSPSRFAYITNNGAAASVSLYTVNADTGDLRMRGYKPTRVVTESNPPWTSCVTTDPEYKYAYVSNPGSGATGNVRIYSIGSTDVFTELPNSPFATSAPLNCIQFEPSGKFGYALGNWNGVNKLVGYSRDAATGLLTELAWSPMTVGNDPTGLAIDPLGQYLYFVTLEVTSGKPTAINGYSINPDTGALASIAGMPIPVSNTATGIAIVHPSGNFAYISHGGGKTVDVYAIDRSTGLLNLVPGASMTTDVNPSALVFSADGSFAYMSAAVSAQENVKTGTLTTFRVDDATGKLTQVGNIPAGTIPQALTLDSSGRFLYLNDNSNYLRVHQLQDDGTPKYVRSIQTRSGQLSIAMIPGDQPITYTPRSLLVTTKGDNSLSSYNIAEDGSLTLTNSIGTPASPNSLALLPWGTQALVAADMAPAGGNLGTYSVDRLTGAVTYKAFIGDAQVANSVALDPGEEYTFQSDSSGGVLRTYGRFLWIGDFWGLLSYGQPGSFTSTFPAGPGAGPMAALSSGRFVYVANQSANSITVFNFWGQLIEATTAFTATNDGSPYSLGAKPIALTGDPMGIYLYVLCDDNTLRVYSIDSWAASHLQKVASVSLPAAPTSLTTDPTGQFVYVGDVTGNVSPFAVNTTSGALTALAPSPLDAPVTALTVESSGRFAYVLCGPGPTLSNGAIHAMRINADGTLTELPGSARPANKPSAVAFIDEVH